MTRPVRFLRGRPVGMLLVFCVLACGSCGRGGVVASQDAVSELKVTPAMTSFPPGGTGTFVAVAQGAFATGVQALSAGARKYEASSFAVTRAGRACWCASQRGAPKWHRHG